jgi:DNA-directed RNA polymerase subunit L
MKHRVEMLPVKCRPSEEDTVRNARILLRVPPILEGAASAPTRILTTDDFVVEATRTDLLLKDRDLGSPMFFLKLRPSETVHLTARLRVNPSSSHMCVATYSYHVDEEVAKLDAEKFADKVQFTNFHRQLSYHRDGQGRPDWFDFTVESIGVVPAKDVVLYCLKDLMRRAPLWVKESPIVREAEPNVYHIVSTTEGHTMGALAQVIAYGLGMCSFVSYDVPHPLRPEMKFRFLTTKTPEEVLETIGKTIVELCDRTISGIDK